MGFVEAVEFFLNMPYTVFALKWRPKNFDEIIGQGHIVTTLKSALQKNRLAHAYLFSGPRGIGKTSTARILAKALNCKDGPTLNPCGKCSSCMEISQGRGLDVIEIDGASNTSVDDVRALRENVKFAPVSGKFKIYIIDEVHMLSVAAFNALLKTLEEPPDFVKFVFATTHPDKIPATVLSRCQRLHFRRISVMEIIAQLEKIVTTENIGVDKEVLFAIAKSSDGSLRDAESVLDQLASFSKDKVSLKDVISVLGLVEQEALFQITDNIIRKDASAALGLLNSVIEDGKDVAVFLIDLIEHFRNLMIAKVTKGDSRLIDLPEEICTRLLKQSEAFTLEEIFGIFNILVNTQQMSKRLDSLRIPLEITLVKLTHDKKNIGSASPPLKYPESPQGLPPKETLIKNKPDNIEAKKEEEPPDSVGSAQAQQQIISLENIMGIWQKVLDNLERIKISVATYLNKGQPLKIHGSTLTVAFPRSHSLHKESLERKENREIIEKCISELLNTSLRVNFILSDECKPREDNENSPIIKSALDMFNGRVISAE